MPTINGKNYDLINGQLVENQAPKYVQEDAMVNNVTRNANVGPTSGYTETTGQVAPTRVNQPTPGTYNFMGRQIDMSGTPVTLSTTDLSRIQELQTMQRTPEQEQEFDKLKFKVAGANAQAQQQPTTQSRSYEIQKNLEEGYKNAPQLFSDRETYNQAYNYGTKPVAEKQALDTFWNAKQSDSNTAFNNLKAGLSVPKGTPAYNQAQARLNSLNKYGSFTPTQLSQAINIGEILPNTQEYNDLLAQNPTLVQNAIKISQIKPTSNIEAQANAQINKIVETTGIGKYLEDGTITADELNKITDTTETQIKQNKLSQLTASREELQKKYDDIENQIDKEHPGIASSYRSKLIANEQRKQLPALNFAITQEKDLAGEIASAKKDATELFRTNLDLYKDRANKAYEMQKTQEQRAYDEYKARRELLDKEGDINSTDPYIKQKAITNAVDGVLKTYKDIPMVRSREQMIADITNAVNAGQDLGQAISQNIIAPIQTKPEYQAKIAEDKAKGIKYETYGGKVYKIENGVLTDTGISAIEPEKSQFTTIGQDEYGNDIKGFVNPATQTVTPYGGATTAQTTTTQTTPASFIASQEGFRATPYWDVNGLAIGYGQHSINGRPVKEGDTITQAEAQKDMDSRIANMTWHSLVKVPLSSSQQAALSSFEYNLGSGIWKKSAQNIIDKINAGDFVGAGNEMKKYNHAAGKVNSGLTSRRNEEASLLTQTTQTAQPAKPKEYTATDIALFNKFLSGKDDANDTKTLKRLGYTRSDIDAYAKTKPKDTSLTDDQRAMYNSQLTAFRGNQVVKDYESMIGQTQNVLSSINQNSGAGDIATVYQFMKALDPTSVVRETEFSTAANSAGLVGGIQNMFSKLENGQTLTGEQKENFKKLMQAYVKNKSQQYDRLYDDMERVLQQSGVPTEYLPARASLTKQATTTQATAASTKIQKNINKYFK